MAEKKYHFEFNTFAKSIEDQYSQIEKDKKIYDKEMKEMNEAVLALDRYDDFSNNKIDYLKYKKTIYTNGYGIEEKENINQNEIILEHQRKASQAFLSELRGFGILADVVGSGKTYEAGVVLSELAIRGKVESLLIIVPNQIILTWKKVLEEEFGLGIGALTIIKKQTELASLSTTSEISGIFRATRPILITTEDFANFDDAIAKYLFDVIVVDEAHHLCQEEGEYANAMYLLSLLMDTKKKAQKTYCLLLTATPHQGNLEAMFRLWYFVRCKGGNPADFKSTTKHTQDFLKEREYYKNHVCLGATNVMEFIKKAKKEALVYGNYRQKFTDFLKNECKTSELNLEKILSSLSEYNVNQYIDEFLNLDINENIKEDIMAKVASKYHNGLLRSIMIRQANKSNSRWQTKKKNIVNYLFVKANISGNVPVKGLREDEEILYDYDSTMPNIDQIITMPGGRKLTMRQYLYDRKGERRYNDIYSIFMFENVYGEDVLKSNIFNKVGSRRFYQEEIKRSPDACQTSFIPIKNNILESKLEVTNRIIDFVSQDITNSRIIIFFDYEYNKILENEGKETTYDYLEKNLRLKYDNRLIIAKSGSKDEISEAFNNKEDAILIVKDASYTEGTNLQSCSVIINFDVTPDPLAMEQRVGRIFRLGQTNDVTIYSLADAKELEGYTLMYFSRIGLMNSDDGDAAIIAGCNSDRMVTVVCPSCGSVRLYSEDEYNDAKKRGELYCTNTRECMIKDKRGTEMTEISTYTFKCDNDDCGAILDRNGEATSYMCAAVTSSGRGYLRNGSGEKGNRMFYCSKICVISHCKRFTEGALKDKCPALKLYNENKDIGITALQRECNTCALRGNLCFEKCHIDTGPEAIKDCINCTQNPKISRECNPSIINFDEKWHTKCPSCNKGTLKPVIAKTFVTYIRNLWSYNKDGGASFCSRLLNEAEKVAQIEEILNLDGVK